MKRILLFVFLSSAAALAQNTSKTTKVLDSLASKSYFDLYKLFFENNEEQPDKALIYAKAYLTKGKNENNTRNTAYGYFLISRLYKEDSLCLKYGDSIIQFTKDNKNDGLAIRGHLLKGDYFVKKGGFHEAWRNYKKANRVIVKNPNSFLVYRYNRSLGVLKSRIGKHNEAIKIFRECYDFVTEKNFEDEFKDILFLASEFNQLHLLDSASYYNDKGIKGTLGNPKKKRLYTLFVLNSGVTLYHKKAYQRATDSILKVLPYLKKNNEIQELLTAYLYLGSAYSDMNLKDQGAQYLLKMDAIVQDKGVIIPDISKGYELLINHFAAQNNAKKKLLYRQKQSKIDSILSGDKIDALQKILSEYDILAIVSKKDIEIYELEDKGVIFRRIIVAIVLFFMISIGIIIYLYNDRKRYRKSFRAVVSHTNTARKVDPNFKSENKKELKDLNISPESIQRILKGIQDFESKQRYLDKKYSQNVLAKELNTNSTYLSKIVNVYIGKSFSGYLHDLRIGYAIDRLKDDKRFRLYSIKGISEEVGFKTSEAFAKAFHKKTGIYPSSFIAKLKET